MATKNVYSPDYDNEGNPKPSIPELRDAIEAALTDAENFATATSSFTDDLGNSYNKGAKGFAQDAEEDRTDAENHAQATSSFTDQDGTNFDKGAKGYKEDITGNLLDRAAIVDASLSQNSAPYFNDPEQAVNWARSEVSTNGGEARVLFYFDGNGDPLDSDITTYAWYTSDSADDDITYMSALERGYTLGTTVPSNLPEGHSFLDVSASPPTLYVGPSGGGTPVQIYDSANVDITGGSITGTTIYDAQATIADDGANQFGVGSGLLIVRIAYTNDKSQVGLFLTTNDGNTIAPAASIVKVDDLSAGQFTATTGTLGGTDGNDGEITVSVVRSGRFVDVYVENRIGEEVTCFVTTF